ncbi:unnamed protein product [Ixodes hexagonus]
MAELEASSRRELRKSADLRRILFKEQEEAKLRHIRQIVKKAPWERTPDEECMLENSSELVKVLQERSRKRRCNQQRLEEVQDLPTVLEEKCRELATAISGAKRLVVYTGAGISTAARIPDYRGPSGVWTLLQKGMVPKVQDLSRACPTFTHMAIAQLQHAGLVKHVVSQNCDGLHVRSGLPRTCLSELHGNMFLEVCPSCKPLRQYFRLFDVTERTALHKHRTGRKCHVCSSELVDTIVHFGETGKLRWPLNWQGAGKAADRCDAILCLGSSLKVLRRYRCLWAMDRPARERPKLYIVNLQWTPKDDMATLKINGRCDEVMQAVMGFLNIRVPEYDSTRDPLFKLHTPIRIRELKTFSRSPLLLPMEDTKADVKPPAGHSLKAIGNGEDNQQHIFADHCYARSNGTNATRDNDNASGSDTEVDESRSGSENDDDSEEAEATKDVKREATSEEEDANEKCCTDVKRVKLLGWYGKGCAKWRLRRKR